MKASLIRLIMGILAIAAIAPASLDAQTSAPPAQAAPLYTAAQLDQLLAPVALYPDQLLEQILMASTYPLEVVEAARLVEDPNNARLKGDQFAGALQDKDWGPSVKSLAPFPQIVRMMDDRLRGYSPPQAGVCTDIQLTRWRCSLIQTSLHLLSRRSAIIYDPTGQHLTKSFVKETSMSSVVSNPRNPAALSIRVEGMACDSCVERVEKAIRATPGVVSASVNLATKRAEVTFSGVPDIAAVIAAVGVAGYECMLENASSSNLS